ncbi:MAG: hypothetical protein JOZ90_03585 [Alphaproteobacteria bacterium]|nr:hypothetical protein [Alphaproteobacteria bacterium]MBV9370607.1 hypothetical protein [Alphaproteobacteria bacterium]MBV9900161.1 hypothetical protein [Alphaproteobacteria bacterium]
MNRRSIAKTLFELAAGSGLAAVIGALTLSNGAAHFSWLWVLGVVLGTMGLIGLFWMLIFPAEKQSNPPGPSTTFKIRGGGTLDLEDIESSADTVVGGQEVKDITAKRVRHIPSGGRTGGGNDRGLPINDS